LSLVRVPDLGRLVVACARQALAVGAEGDAADGLCVPLEGAKFLSLLRVPYLHCPVAETGEAATVRTDRGVRERAGVACESLLVAGEEGVEMVVFPTAFVPARRGQMLHGHNEVIVFPRRLSQLELAGIQQSLGPLLLLLGNVAGVVGFGPFLLR